jgi:methylmalonyl-CoA mutase
MAKAIETGLPKMKIEEAAARKQARIDSNHDIIVGINQYKSQQEPDIELLSVDNTAVRNGQLKRLKQLKESRDDSDVNEVLDRLTNCAKSQTGNLLEIAIEAAQKRTTLGEISMAMEKAFGRHKATIRSISGVYASELKNDDNFKLAIELSNKFAEVEGRRARILIAKMGQDGHDRGAKVISTSFADLGFDVDIGPLFQTPEEVANQSAENDVHVVGVSSLAGGHKTLVPQLVKSLEKIGRSDILITVGGVIPPQDVKFLKNQGVFKIFGPGTVISKAAIDILNKLLNH